MGDFLAFRKMITPAVIQLFFWLGVIVCLIAGIGILSNGETLAAASPVPPTLTAVLVLVVGPLIVRIYCELLMVLFDERGESSQQGCSVVRSDRAPRRGGGLCPRDCGVGLLHPGLLELRDRLLGGRVQDGERHLGDST